MVDESDFSWISYAPRNPRPKDGEPLTIFSLPQELLQMIMIAPNLDAEDQFAFKLASREFYHLKPDWETLKSKTKLDYRHDTVCRLYRVLPNSYACSGCQVRHTADMFTPSEWPKGAQERKCTAYTGGLPLFGNICLTFDCVRQSLAGLPAPIDEQVDLLRYWVRNTEPVSGRTGKGVPVWQAVEKYIEVTAASDLRDFQNSIRFTLGREKEHVYIKAVAQIYFPWMDCFVSVAKNHGPSSFGWEALRKTWEQQSATWSCFTCAHRSFSDEAFSKTMENIFRTPNHSSFSFVCPVCETWTRLTISGSPACLTVENTKYLGKGLKSSDPEWKRYIPTEDKQNDCGFGQRWKASSVVTFLGH